MKCNVLAIVLLCLLACRGWAQCGSVPNIVVDTKFFPDYRVASTEKFTATIMPNQSELQSVRVLVNTKEVAAYAKNQLVNIGGGMSYRLETTIGPDLSNAKIVVPLGRNYVTVEALTTHGCRASVKQPMIGADSGVHAVIVGINDYQKVKDLKYAVNDASKFYQFLETRLRLRKRDFIPHFLPNEKATKQEIEIAIDKAASEVSEEGAVIVYFSGHGMVKAKNRGKVKAYLVPHNGDVRLEKSTMLSHLGVVEMLEDSLAKNKIFIFDSCFSGRGAFEEFTIDERHREKFLPLDPATEEAMPHGNVPLYLPDTLLWFSSSSAGKVSYEVDDLGHGLFTYYLLKSIEDTDFVSTRSALSFRDLRDYIRDKIDKDHRSIQRPKILGDDDIPAIGFWVVNE